MIHVDVHVRKELSAGIYLYPLGNNILVEWWKQLSLHYCCFNGISHLEGPSGSGRPPLTMEYNHISYPGTTTQAYREASYHGMHPQSE